MELLSRRLPSLVFLCLIVVAPAAASCSGNARFPSQWRDPGPYARGRILIKFREGESSISLAGAVEKFALHPEAVTCGAVHLYRVRPGSELRAVRVLEKDPAVEYAEPDYIIFAAHRGGIYGGSPGGGGSFTAAAEDDEPDDPLYAQQWALAKLHAPVAWRAATGAGTTIAVIDSGVDLDHPEFAGRIVDGYDFVNEESSADDDYGHGTQVAGVAAAAANNGIGIAGLAREALIMPLKVLDESGRGVSSDLTCALYWAADQGADIVNISIISFGPSVGMQGAINYAVGEGALILAAAGNLYEDGNPVTYPAAHEGVVAVAATNREDGHAWFSSAGSFVDVSAPGVAIFSLFPPSHGEFRSVNGTSLATPHGSGAAALVRSLAPGLSPDQVATILQDSAVDLGASGHDDKHGHGRVDAAAAVLTALRSLPSQLYLPAAEVPSPTATTTSTATPTATATPSQVASPVSTPTGTPAAPPVGSERSP